MVYGVEIANTNGRAGMAAITPHAGHQIDFLTANARNLRDRIARALPAWDGVPGRSFLLGMLALIALIYTAYGRFNHGVEFFPEVEPESAQIWVRARGKVVERTSTGCIPTELGQRVFALAERHGTVAFQSVASGGLLREYVVTLPPEEDPSRMGAGPEQVTPPKAHSRNRLCP